MLLKWFDYKYITKNDGGETLFSEEHAHAYNYAKIQAIRFEGRVSIEFEPFPEAMKHLTVPRLIFQPLLENAFLHGLEQSDGKEQLFVGYRITEDAYRVSVMNTGKPISAETLERLQTEFGNKSGLPDYSGLANIHRRLRLTFGSDSGLLVANREGGVIVEITIQRKDALCGNY